MNHYYYFIIGVIAVLVLIEIGTMITKRSKRKSVDAKYKSGNISEWSYQRFCRFYGDTVFLDDLFNNKMNIIKDAIIEDNVESIEELAKLAACPKSEVVLKVKYLKNKRILGNYYIDKEHGLIKKCSEEDSKLLDKYSDMIYLKHYQISEMAAQEQNYNNKPFQIIEEDIYKDIKYLYDKSLINGIKIDEANKKIVYYTVEKKKLAEKYATLNCPNCGALVDVPRGETARCEYCSTIVEDKR